MKKLKILNVIILAVAIFLEAIPYGVQMRWALGEGLRTTMYHAYFDLVVLGASGDSSPFICAVLTVVITIIVIASFFIKEQKRSLYMALSILSWVAFAFSIMPLVVDHYTIISGIISVILITSAEINTVIRARLNK